MVEATLHPQERITHQPEIERLQNIDVWSMGDQWGPEKVLQTYDPDTGMQGVLVIDNTAIGPGKGGIRFQSNITPLEIFRLSRTMTWKCALASLPFGGAKGGIRGDPLRIDRVSWMRSFARAIKPYIPHQYIGATDMGTSELDMAVFAHEVGNMKACTGKPSELGGIPHELGTTGFGVATATDLSINIQNKLNRLNLDPKEASVAIQGFGNVGSFTAKFLDSMGFKIVAVSDVSACIYNPDGLEIIRIMKELRKSRNLGDLEGYKKGAKEKIFDMEADIFIPAATSDTINSKTVHNLLASKTKMVIEAANIPTTADAEGLLREKEVEVVPDIIANAGGVIGSYVEYQGNTEKEAFDLIKYRITNNLRRILVEAEHSDRSPRVVAEDLAKARVMRAMLLRKGAIDVAREAFGREDQYDYGIPGDII